MSDRKKKWFGHEHQETLTRLWALILAGPIVVLLILFFALVVWLGGWPFELDRTRLEFLGWSLVMMIAILAVLLSSLAVVSVKVSGPVGTALEVNQQPRRVEVSEQPAPVDPKKDDAVAPEKT